MAYIENFPAPERAGGEYTGNPVTAYLGGGPSMQPQGANNPEGNVPGIPAMALNAATLAMLSGPQPAGVTSP
jgi:hypothetical protein